MLRGYRVANREDGQMCGRWATNLDHQRGGVVCDRHRPRLAATREPAEYERPARQAELMREATG